jgi:hypothetical protein
LIPIIYIINRYFNFLLGASKKSNWIALPRSIIFKL